VAVAKKAVIEASKVDRPVAFIETQAALGASSKATCRQDLVAFYQRLHLRACVDLDSHIRASALPRLPSSSTNTSLLRESQPGRISYVKGSGSNPMIRASR
jgi:hypothetical protein